MNSTQSQWLTRQQAADKAGVGLSTIARWLRNGTLTRHRSAVRGVWIDPDELDELIKPKPESQRRKSA